MLTYDPEFVLADIRRTRSELQDALIACDQLIGAPNPETAVRELPITGMTVVESAKRAWQFARSAQSKAAELKRQRRAAA